MLLPLRRLEIMSVVGSAPTLVNPPGMTLYPWLRSPLLPWSVTANVRRTVGLGSSVPVAVTVGAVEGSMISCPTH